MRKRVVGRRENESESVREKEIFFLTIIFFFFFFLINFKLSHKLFIKLGNIAVH